MRWTLYPRRSLGDEVDAFSEEELARRPEVRIINRYAVVLAYIRIGLKGIGALALLWATVVLLGGFVSSLGKTDFWSLTIISFVQAAGLSDAMGDNRFAFIEEWLSSSLKRNFDKNLESRGERKHHHEHTKLPMGVGQWLLREISAEIDAIMFVIFFAVASFVVAGPIICVTLSATRVIKQDYGIDKGDASKANLKPALNLFYYVSLVHGALYLLLLLVEVIADQYILVTVSQQHDFSKEIIDGYLGEVKQMCVNNPASTKNLNLITYGAGLLDSQLPEDYSSGGRVLTMLIDQDIPVPIRRLLIRSPRQRILKLIGTLAWRSPEEREMRWLAARTVEHLAGDLSLAEFPGALHCISSLLDNSCHNTGDQEALHLPFEIVDHQLEDEDGSLKAKWRVSRFLMAYLRELIRKKCGAPENGGTEEQDSKQGDEDLVLPGLRILANLAHDGHNCTTIYSTKGLLTKLVAPVSSNTFIEDTETNAAWTKVVDGSLKVVSRLMSSPGNTGEEMRSQIAADANAVKNLEAVLEMDMKSNSSIIELQIRAIEVLAQLVLHHRATSATGTREHLIERALHFFITNNWMEDYLIDEEIADQNTELSRPPTGGCMDNIAMIVYSESAKQEKKTQAAEARVKKKMKEAKGTVSLLKEKAGEALAMLSMGNHSNSESSRSFTKSENVIHRLTELLDSNIKTIQCRISATETVEIDITMGCRISAAVILKHSSNHLKEQTLGKVLVELLPIQASNSSTPRWWERACCISVNKNDEENPSDGGQSHMQKSEERRLQAELLSLIAAIRASSNLSFASMLPQDVVVRLKKMVDNNMYTTPACLAILKITCDIVIEFIPHDGNAELIEKHDIVGTLLKASKRMATLESGMLFAGDDHDCYGVPLKPLSSVLVKKAQDLLAKRTGINAPAGRS